MTQYEYWNNQKNKYIALSIIAAHRGEIGRGLRYSETAKACELILSKLTIEEAQKEVDTQRN